MYFIYNAKYDTGIKFYFLKYQLYKYKVNCKVKADKFVDDYTTTCILIEDSVNNRNVSSSNSGWGLLSKADEEWSCNGSDSAKQTESETPGEFCGGSGHVASSEGLFQGGKNDAGDNDQSAWTIPLKDSLIINLIWWSYKSSEF